MRALVSGLDAGDWPGQTPCATSRSSSDTTRVGHRSLRAQSGTWGYDPRRSIAFHGLLLASGTTADVSSVLSAAASVSREEWLIHGLHWNQVATDAAARASELHTCRADRPIWCALVRDRGPHLTWCVIYRDGWEAHRRSTAVLQRRLARAVVDRHRKPARSWFTEDNVRYAQWLGGSEIDRARGYVRFEWRPERVS
jgi:hypothetical protein